MLSSLLIPRLSSCFATHARYIGLRINHSYTWLDGSSKKPCHSEKEPHHLGRLRHEISNRDLYPVLAFRRGGDVANPHTGFRSERSDRKHRRLRRGNVVIAECSRQIQNQ